MTEREWKKSLSQIDRIKLPWNCLWCCLELLALFTVCLQLFRVARQAMTITLRVPLEPWQRYGWRPHFFRGVIDAQIDGALGDAENFGHLAGSLVFRFGFRHLGTITE